MSETQDNEIQKKLIEEIIFNSYGIKVVHKFDKDWEFRTLNKQEHTQVWSIATISDDDATNWNRFKLEIIKMALIKLNNIPISEEVKEEQISKLPSIMIDALFEEYQKLDDIQIGAIENREIIQLMTEDFYSRVRYKVMKATGALPTEDRVKQMNEHQWLWYYYNLQEDEKEEEERIKQRIDYLSFFINPEMATKVREQAKHQEKKGNVVKTKAHEEVNPYNENEVIAYGDTTVDDDFDAKLKMFMKDEVVTELSDEYSKGDAMESKDDFISRVLSATNVIEQENNRVLQQLEEEAKKAGVNPDDLDVIDVK